MAGKNPSLFLVSTCFEKCGLGFGGIPKPLSAIILCEGRNYKDMKDNKTACPVVTSFFSNKNRKELEENYLSMVKHPEYGKKEIISFFGDAVWEYSKSLEKAIELQDFSKVDPSFALSFILASHRWNVPYVIPFETEYGPRTVLVAEKEGTCFVIAPVSDSIKMGEDMLKSFNKAIQSETYKEVHHFIVKRKTVYLVATILKLPYPVSSGLSYHIEAWVLPYLLRTKEPKKFLDFIKNQPLHEFLKHAKNFEAPLVRK